MRSALSGVVVAGRRSVTQLLTSRLAGSVANVNWTTFRGAEFFLIASSLQQRAELKGC
jgi:hypothetical protein